MANRKNITIKKLKQNQTEKGNRVSLLALQRLNEDKRYKYVHNDFKKSKKINTTRISAASVTDRLHLIFLMLTEERLPRLNVYRLKLLKKYTEF